MVKEKNADELFQNFLWHTTGAQVEAPKANTDVVDVGKDDIRKDRKQG